MITYNIFLWSGIFALIILGWQFGKFAFYSIKFLLRRRAVKPDNLLEFIWAGIRYPLTVFFLSVFSLSLVLGHIIPYIAQERDHMLIMEYNDNIILYENYSEEYAEAARQQIEEYQRLQSELASRATIQQLQFFAEQEDVVGNSLTNEIRRFQELIMEQELEINKARSRVLRRPLNAWFFGITEFNQK